MEFSEHEAVRVHGYVSQILQEIEAHPRPGHSFSSLIPHFQGKENPMDAGRYDKVPFWEHCDLSLTSLRLRLGVNQRSAEYELYMNSPINAEASLKRDK